MNTPDSSRAPTASVIIKTRNALPYVKLVLECLHETPAGVDTEIIVCDDKSSTEVIQYLITRPIKLVLNRDDRVGAPGGGDQGFRLARGQYVAYLDSDILVPRYWLRDLITELEEHAGTLISARRQKGLRHPDEDRSLENAWNAIKSSHGHLGPLEMFLAFSRGRGIDAFAEAVMAKSPSTEVLKSPPFFVGSSCIVARKEAITAAGGFLVRPFFPYGGEDVDLCWRLGRSGGRILRSGHVHAHHFEHGSEESRDADYGVAISRCNEILFPAWRNELEAYLRHAANSGMTEDEVGRQHRLFAQYLEWRKT